MSGPDGPEQREAERQEWFQDEMERCAIDEQLADESRDRMWDHFFEIVTGEKA